MTAEPGTTLPQQIRSRASEESNTEEGQGDKETDRQYYGRERQVDLSTDNKQETGRPTDRPTIRRRQGERPIDQEYGGKGRQGGRPTD